MVRDITHQNLILIAVAAISIADARAESYRSPFPYSDAATDEGATECAAPPPAPHNLMIETIYPPGDLTHPDHARIDRRKEATRDIVRFTAEITKLADRAAGRTEDEIEPLKACMLRWWNDWAAADALLGRVNQEGGYERKWHLAAWTLAYLRLYGGRQPPSPSAAVAKWFQKLAAAVQAEYPAGATAKNNHYYWAALAVAGAGVVIGDQLSYKWAMNEYRAALAAVDDRGFLPLELKRGAAALHYHVFSTSALTMLAAIDAANGGAQLEQTNGSLQRLVATTLSGLDDSAPFAERAGVPQAMTSENLDRREFAWLEAYAFLHPEPAIERRLTRMRPLRTIWLGGSMTQSFAGRTTTQ